MADGGTPALTLGVVEDESLLRDLLLRSLGREESVAVVGSYSTGEAALAALPQLRPDVVILDIDLGAGMNGVETGVALRRAMPKVGLLLLSNIFDPQLLTALPSDVRGGWSYLLKRSLADLDMLVRAIKGTAEGYMMIDPALAQQVRPKRDRPLAKLSPRQLEILGLIASGYSNAVIADRLVLSERSVENHISRIYMTLGIDASNRQLHPRVQAVISYLAESVTVPEAG